RRARLRRPAKALCLMPGSWPMRRRISLKSPSSSWSKIPAMDRQWPRPSPAKFSNTTSSASILNRHPQPEPSASGRRYGPLAPPLADRIDCFQQLLQAGDSIPLTVQPQHAPPALLQRREITQRQRQVQRAETVGPAGNSQIVAAVAGNEEKHPRIRPAFMKLSGAVQIARPAPGSDRAIGNVSQPPPNQVEFRFDFRRLRGIDQQRKIIARAR